MKLLKIGLVAPCVCGIAALSAAPRTAAQAPETIGGGTVTTPAVGPPPSFGIGGPGMVLVKNWRFGTHGTIKNYADMSANFFYHDQFGTIGNGTNYGAHTVAPDGADALPGQPVEGVNSPPVRVFTADSMKTLLTPLNGAATVDPNQHNAGCGSFMAQWKLPHGGSLLGRDMVWETRVRYNPPPYFWFAIWNAGNKWKWDNGAAGAENDLVESFGYDNPNSNGPDWTNYDGRFWHSGSVSQPSRDTVGYADWGRTMGQQGVSSYDAAQYHTWTLQYSKDNSYAAYVDGFLVQRGSDFHWTFGSKPTDEPIDMDFLFDAGWGHTQIGSVNKPLPASAFDGKFYEWSYSRVYLSADAAPRGAAFHGPHLLPGTIKAADFDTGGPTISYYSRPGTLKSAPRPQDRVALEPCTDSGGGFALAGAARGQYVKYTVRIAKAGTYAAAFRVASAQLGGSLHLEDAHGRNISGPVSAPGTAVPSAWSTVSTTVAVPAGPQTLTVVQDAPGIKLNWFKFGAMVAPGPLPDGAYRLLTGKDALALDVSGQHTENGSGLDLYGYNGQGNQTWTLHHLGNGVYEIVGAQSGRSLTAAGGSVVISDFQDQPGQKWVITGTPGAFKIKSLADGRLFGADASGTLSLAPDTGLPGQMWKVELLP